MLLNWFSDDDDATLDNWAYILEGLEINAAAVAVKVLIDRMTVLLTRILQATLTAFSDYRFFIWMGKKKWSLFLIIVPWFWFYTGSRTLANTLETSLTTIALSYFPWHSEESSTYMWPALFCCYIRPTAVVIWLPLGIYHLRKTRLSVFDLIAKRFLLIGLVIAAVCISVDTYLHGHLIITPYEFMKYNIFHNIGSFYGSHPWYWYFTIGLPTVLGINTVPFIVGVAETIRHHEVFPVRKYLLITILLSMLTLSTVDHKEFRFIASLLPLCLYISADTLTRWSYKASKAGKNILVYQRLRAGEENTYNREEFQRIEGEDDIYDNTKPEILGVDNDEFNYENSGQVEHNLFN